MPLIAVDSTQLANSNNRKQIVTVPAGTADFWLSFVNGSGGIELTDKIVSNITGDGLKNKLAALPTLTGNIASVARVDGDTTAYLITFTSLTNMHTLGAAGGFSLDFGASLGGLASLTTTGSIIPLARLVATLTFGINLNPTSAIAVGPAQFDSGPRVDATTSSDGGKSISIRDDPARCQPLPARLVPRRRTAAGTSRSPPAAPDQGPANSAERAALDTLSRA